MSDYIIHVGVTTSEGTTESLAMAIEEEIEAQGAAIKDYDVWFERSDSKADA